VGAVPGDTLGSGAGRSYGRAALERSGHRVAATPERLGSVGVSRSPRSRVCVSPLAAEITLSCWLAVLESRATAQA